MEENVRQSLNRLVRINKSVSVQRFIDFPNPWMKITNNDFTDQLNEYLETYGEPNHREILQNEVVIDVDSETVEDGIKHADLVEQKLRSKNISFTRYKSGGTGQHFHLIFPTLPKHFTGKVELAIAKYAIIEILLGKRLLEPKDIKSHICMHNKTLIQIEGVKHRKGGVKQLISKTEGFVNRKFPSQVFKILEEKAEERKRIRANINRIGKLNELNCIDFFNGKEIEGLRFLEMKDGYNRAMFALSAFYVQQGYAKEKIMELLKAWWEKFPEDVKRTNLNIDYKIRATVNSNKGTMGCSYKQLLLDELKANKVCEKCPYNKWVENTATK